MAGLNLTVFGLMAVIVGSDDGKKDPKLEMVGLEAIGFAITVLSLSLSSILYHCTSESNQSLLIRLEKAL